MAEERSIISRAEAKARGLKKYFTGQKCAQGHLSERKVNDLGCIECGHKYSNAWKENNRERSREITREWKAANPTAGLEWHQSNRNKSRSAAKRYYQKNKSAAKERATLSGRKRRAQKKGSGGTHTAADLREILKAQNYRCAYCPADLRKVKRHVDHIKPLSAGGSNDKTNIQYLCQPCNLSKGAKDPIAFAREIGLLF